MVTACVAIGAASSRGLAQPAHRDALPSGTPNGFEALNADLIDAHAQGTLYDLFCALEIGATESMPWPSELQHHGHGPPNGKRNHRNSARASAAGCKSHCQCIFCRTVGRPEHWAAQASRLEQAVAFGQRVAKAIGWHWADDATRDHGTR